MGLHVPMPNELAQVNISVLVAKFAEAILMCVRTIKVSQDD